MYICVYIYIYIYLKTVWKFIGAEIILSTFLHISIISPHYHCSFLRMLYLKKPYSVKMLLYLECTLSILYLTNLPDTSCLIQNFQDLYQHIFFLSSINLFVFHKEQKNICLNLSILTYFSAWVQICKDPQSDSAKETFQ